MSFFDQLNSPRSQTIFRSYWIHTIFQFLVISYFYFDSNPEISLALAIFLNYTIMVIFYVAFQIPITGLILIWADRLTQKLSEGQGLFFRIILSTGLFVFSASGLLFLVIHLFRWSLFPHASLYESLKIILTYCTPVFFSAELLRQTFVLKKVYGNQN